MNPSYINVIIHKSVFLSLILTGAIIAGCSKNDAPDSSSSATSQPVAQQTSVNLTAPANNNAPVVAPPGAVAAPAAPTAPDFASAKRPLNDKGDPMSDLEYLNHLVFEVNESRINKEVPLKSFKTEAEQAAYEEVQHKKMEPVHNLQELVDAGVLKAVPQASNGQHYAIDPATGKVVLQ